MVAMAGIDRNAPNLYAVTWLPINECGGKLDIAATPMAPGTWRNQKDMPASRATLARQPGEPCPPAVQGGSDLAREAA